MFKESNMYFALTGCAGAKNSTTIFKTIFRKPMYPCKICKYAKCRILFKIAKKLSKHCLKKFLLMLITLKSFLEMIMSLAGIICLDGCYSG